MPLYYLFACEVDDQARSGVPWRQLDLARCHLDGKPLRTWDDIRHVLELKLFGERGLAMSRYRVVGYLSAMHRDMYKLCGCKYNANHRLGRADQLNERDSLILFRKPAAPYLAKYVPARFAPVADASEGSEGEEEEVKAEAEPGEADDEETRLRTMVAASVAAANTQLASVQKPASKKRATAIMHPDEYEYDKRRRPVPPADYLCRGCGEEGAHFRQDCPLEDENEQGSDDADQPPRRKAVDKIFVPTGIPKTFLQHLADESLDKQTMVTRDGAFVKHMHPLHALRLKMSGAGDVDIRITRTDFAAKEEEGELYFDFEDHLYQVVDVREAALIKEHAPARKIQFMCTHWMQGLCHKGVLCEYLHYYDVQFMPICKFFMEGKCTNGACTYRHDMPTSVKRSRPCQDYARGFCARGPACALQHMRRTAPCIADFDNAATFHAMVAAFDQFMEETRQDVVRAKKRYQRAPAVTKKLYSLTKKMKVLK